MNLTSADDIIIYLYFIIKIMIRHQSTWTVNHFTYPYSDVARKLKSSLLTWEEKFILIRGHHVCWVWGSCLYDDSSLLLRHLSTLCCSNYIVCSYKMTLVVVHGLYQSCLYFVYVRCVHCVFYVGCNIFFNSFAFSFLTFIASNTVN